MAHYHEVEGRPGLLRTETGDDTTPEGVETRVNEVYRAPLFQIDDIVIRVGKNIHGERNLGEPCTVIFVDKYAKPYHYTVKDPFGQEIGVAETYLTPCEEVMYLADRENAEVVDYESQRKFPEQQTKEGKHQENGFRVEVVPNEEMIDLPDELEMPVVPAKKKRRGGAEVIDDFWATLIERICWAIIICLGVFWVWVAIRGTGNTVVPLRSYFFGNGKWQTEEELKEEMLAERKAKLMRKIPNNVELANRTLHALEQLFTPDDDTNMTARARRQKLQRLHRRPNQYGSGVQSALTNSSGVRRRPREHQSRVYARSRDMNSPGVREALRNDTALPSPAPPPQSIPHDRTADTAKIPPPDFG